GLGAAPRKCRRWRSSRPRPGWITADYVAGELEDDRLGLWWSSSALVLGDERRSDRRLAGAGATHGATDPEEMPVSLPGPERALVVGAVGLIVGPDAGREPF